MPSSTRSILGPLGLDNGVTPEELSEMMAQITLYSGFPSGVNGSREDVSGGKRPCPVLAHALYAP